MIYFSSTSIIAYSILRITKEKISVIKEKNYRNIYINTSVLLKIIDSDSVTPFHCCRFDV